MPPAQTKASNPGLGLAWQLPVMKGINRGAGHGKLSPEVRGRRLDLLRSFGANERIPVAGYDVIAGQWRVVRASLLDAVSTG